MSDTLDENKGTKVRAEILRSPEYREQLGSKLKEKRLESGYSFSDMVDMAEIPLRTCLNIEKGIATNIDYYIEYSKTLEYPLPELFNITITLGPKNQLSAEKQARVFLARKIRALMVEEGFFKEETTVKQVKDRLVDKGEVDDSKKLSTEISGVLISWCKKEESILVKQKIDKKNNVYKLAD